MDFVYIFRVIINRLPIIIVITFLAALITGVLTYLSPKKYQSDVLLSTGYTVSSSFDLAEQRFSLVEADLKFNNLIEEMNSNILVGTLSHHLLLHDLTEEIPFKEFEEEEKLETDILNGIPKDTIVMILQEKIRNFELLSSYDDTERSIAATILDYQYSPSDIRGSMDIRRANYTDYISVIAETEDPFLSAFMVNTLCDEFLRYNRMIRFSQSTESEEYLSSLAEQKRQVLETKSNNLKAYKSRNQFLDFELESESKLDQLKNVEEQKNETLNEINRINLSIASIDAKIAESEIEDPVSSDEFADLRKRLAHLNERRRKRLGNYKVLTDSIYMIRNELDNMVNRSSPPDRDLLTRRESLNMDLQIQENKLANLEKRSSKLEGQVSSFVSTEASISFLQREVDIAAEEYLKVQEKLNDVRNASYNSKDALKVILWGQPAIEHQSSGLFVKVAISIMGSLTVCLAFLLSIEFINSRIKIASRFRQMVNMDLIGTIKNREKPKKLKKGRTDKAESIAATQLRKLRNKIVSQDGRIILWTSLNPGDGKSSTIYAMANSLGLINKNVLILDTNFRSNKFFKDLAENQKLKVNLNPFREIQKNIHNQPSKYDRVQIFGENYSVSQKNESVHIIPNKGPEGSPAEVLSGIALDEILHQLLENNVYDYIFLEGASLNEYSDAIELTTYADRVVLVFDALKNLDQRDQDTLKSVNGFNGKLLGGVLNRELELKEV